MTLLPVPGPEKGPSVGVRHRRDDGVGEDQEWKRQRQRPIRGVGIERTVPYGWDEFIGDYR